LICQGNATSGMIVPDVTGKREPDAKAALSAAGFNVDVRRIVTSSASAGMVVAQTPQEKDTRSEAGATVGLLVSAGADPALRLPSVLGASLVTAQDKLRSLGFNVLTVPLPKGQQPGIVTQQFPAGGLTYQLGLPVLLYAPQEG
jgi:beta-lactam-binding protein with PASTA domain